MIIHSVFFWLKADLSEDERASFLRGIESLRRIEAVKALHLGRPALIPARPVVDASYTYALNVTFNDIAGHDAYQVDPIHRSFVDANRNLWTRVQIYDADVS
jgi:hypothetical protein